MISVHRSRYSTLKVRTDNNSSGDKQKRTLKDGPIQEILYLADLLDCVRLATRHPTPKVNAEVERPAGLTLQLPVPNWDRLVMVMGPKPALSMAVNSPPASATSTGC